MNKEINIKDINNKKTYTISSDVNIICPIVSKIFGKTYKVSIDRVVYE